MSELSERILSGDKLPSLPGVAVEILRVSRDPDASADDLCEVIQHDPALTGRMLKVVNSPMFGIPRAVGTLKQAVTLLGQRAVKTMALSFSLIDTLRGDERDAFDFEGYWRRSLHAAVGARQLARAAQPTVAEEAFVAGLLSDLGMVAAWRCAPDEYEPVLNSPDDERHLVELEVAELGVSHAELSGLLLQNWGLPESVCRAVAAHHGEGLSNLEGGEARLAGVVHSAAGFADVFCGVVPATKLGKMKQRCRELTGINEAALESVLDQLANQVTETATMLSVQVGRTLDYVALQAEAARQLSLLSIEAESERILAARQAEKATRENSRLLAENQRILEAASIDGLTKIANRAAFDRQLESALKRAASQDGCVALIMLDVDEFKKFNDTHGHPAGDAVLRTVATCMRVIVREDGFVARYGGEEFAVILTMHDRDGARLVAERLRTTIAAAPTQFESEPLRVTASFGLAISDGSHAADELLAESDRMLYLAKRNGRNRVEIADCATTLKT